MTWCVSDSVAVGRPCIECDCSVGSGCMSNVASLSVMSDCGHVTAIVVLIGSVTCYVVDAVLW